MVVDDIINGKVVPYDVTSVTLNVNDIPVPILNIINKSIKFVEEDVYVYFTYRPPVKYQFWNWLDENGDWNEADNDLSQWLNGLVKTYLMLFFNWNVTYKTKGQEIFVLVHGDNQNREFDNYNFDVEKVGLKPCFDKHGKVYAITVEFNLCLNNTIVESMEKYQ